MSGFNAFSSNALGTNIILSATHRCGCNQLYLGLSCSSYVSTSIVIIFFSAQREDCCGSMHPTRFTAVRELIQRVYIRKDCVDRKVGLWEESKLYDLSRVAFEVLIYRTVTTSVHAKLLGRLSWSALLGSPQKSKSACSVGCQKKLQIFIHFICDC